MKFPKVILAILDGFGIASPSPYNAVSQARPKFFEELIGYYPTFVLQASGPAVGLSWGERGNSEVGHLNIGAGRVVTQEMPRINRAINDGSFYQTPAFLKVINSVLKNNSTLHLIGLLGTGGVHSYEPHLYSLIGLAQDRGVANIAIHGFTDGRDAPTRAALESVIKFKEKSGSVAKIATLTGRFYAMDRGEHWNQTEAAFNAMVKGEGDKFADPAEALASRYNKAITDEMIPPTVITGATGEPVATINEGDGVIFFNFRNDRMLQMTKMFLQKTKGLAIATMTSYNPDFKVDVAFPPIEVKNSLPELISNLGASQFHAAESEKFAHVTFFFNGHRFDPWPKEDRFIIKSPSDNAKNYEDVPEMSAAPLTDQVVKRISERDDKLIVLNYANGDMVGHTGNLDAAVKAVAVLDNSLKRLAEAADKAKALLVITADHGNCEVMRELSTGLPETEHTSNPVPLIFYSESLKFSGFPRLNLSTLAGVAPQGILPDIAPTIVAALGLTPPPEMTGSVLKFEP